MKKWIGLLCGCLIFSNTCSAYTSCNGGKEITAKNGDKFCKSNKPMSWYAAHTWCRANGGEMATFSKMCPGITFASTTKCTNLADGQTNVWCYVNIVNTSNNSNGRLKLKDGFHGWTTPINRCVGSDTTENCELHPQYGAITDLYGFCE